MLYIMQLSICPFLTHQVVKLEHMQGLSGKFYWLDVPYYWWFLFIVRANFFLVFFAKTNNAKFDSVLGGSFSLLGRVSRGFKFHFSRAGFSDFSRSEIWMRILRLCIFKKWQLHRYMNLMESADSHIILFKFSFLT